MCIRLSLYEVSAGYIWELTAVYRNTITIASTYGRNKIVRLPEQKKRHSTSSVMTLDLCTMEADPQHTYERRCPFDALKSNGDSAASLSDVSWRYSIRLEVLFDAQVSVDPRLKSNRESLGQFLGQYICKRSVCILCSVHATCNTQKLSQWIVFSPHSTHLPIFLFILLSIDYR